MSDVSSRRHWIEILFFSVTTTSVDQIMFGVPLSEVLSFRACREMSCDYNFIDAVGIRLIIVGGAVLSSLSRNVV
jgi:hypothetical protein